MPKSKSSPADQPDRGENAMSQLSDAIRQKREKASHGEGHIRKRGKNFEILIMSS